MRSSGSAAGPVRGLRAIFLITIYHIAMLIKALVLATALLAMQAAPRPEFKPSANPVVDAARESLAKQSKNLVESAELMPADKYGYHPTEAQMTFGKLIVHI